MQLYIKQREAVMGPLSLERITAAIAAGRIAVDAQVSEDRMKWYPVSALKAMQAAETAPRQEEEAPARTLQPSAAPPSFAPPSFAPPADGGVRECPYCGRMVRTEARVCRFCHRSLEAAMPAQSIYAVCGECGALVKGPASKQGQSVVCPICGENMAFVQVTSRRCPQCGETVKFGAKICKYCHAALPPGRAVDLTGRVADAVGGQAVAEEGAAHYGVPGGSLPVSDPGLREEMRSFWRRDRVWFFLMFASQLICSLSLFCAILLSDVDEMVAAFFAISAIPVGIFSLVASILWLVNFIKLFYRYWTCVGTGDRHTPGQMVGFCFIPFFGLYWIFRAVWGLAKRLRTLGCANVNPAMALVLCILICVWNAACLVWFTALPAYIAMMVFFCIVFGQFHRAIVGDPTI